MDKLIIDLIEYQEIEDYDKLTAIEQRIIWEIEHIESLIDNLEVTIENLQGKKIDLEIIQGKITEKILDIV